MYCNTNNEKYIHLFLVQEELVVLFDSNTAYENKSLLIQDDEPFNARIKSLRATLPAKIFYWRF
jgi:hypothetical protein